MMKPWAEWFYKSKKWVNCRHDFLSSKHWLCERCVKEGTENPATVAHHKKYLSAENIQNPDISLNWDNLEALCRMHHYQEHHKTVSSNEAEQKYTFDENGQPVMKLKAQDEGSAGQKVFLICGASGSGKTSYVNQIKKHGDLIVDLDYIGATLIGDFDNLYSDHTTILPIILNIREVIYRDICNRVGTWHRAYVLTTEADIYKLDIIANSLRAEIIIMDTSQEECLRRVNTDIRRRNRVTLYSELINKWFFDYESSLRMYLNEKDTPPIHES